MSARRAASSWLPCLLLASLAITGLAQYVSHKLSWEQIENSKEVARRLRLDRTKDETREKLFLTTEKQPWYEPADVTEERFNGIGNLFITKYQVLNGETEYTDGKPTKVIYREVDVKDPIHCTAFYVAKDILATAAHCFKENGVKENGVAKRGHALIFRQQYNGLNAYSDTEAVKHERVVVEWIYPEAFEKGKVAWSPASGSDYAFMRVNEANAYGDNAIYTLTSPDAHLPTVDGKPANKLRLLGYPYERAKYFQLVSVGWSLMRPTDARVLFDKGVAETLKNRKIDDIKNAMVVCNGAKGNIQNGGSGGPWLLDTMAKEQQLTVVAISSFGTRRDWEKLNKITEAAKFETAILADQPLCKASYAAKLTADALKMAATVIQTTKGGPKDGNSFTEALARGTSMRQNTKDHSERLEGRTQTPTPPDFEFWI